MRNIWKISLYLSHALFLLRNLRKRIKRESGANPGQSRCCKLQNGLGNSFMPLTRVGKALIPEVSQKTCNAYFFDGFEDRPEENARTLSGFYYSLSKVFLSSRLMVSDNYFAIIIRERSMNLTDGMSSVCKMHAFFAFKGLGYSVNTL